MKLDVKHYFVNILVSIDQFVNALFAGDPDETISSRSGKFVREGKGWFPCTLCKLLNLIDKDHCIRNIEPDRGNNDSTT